MKGKSIVGQGTNIKNGVKISGPVIIGENCVIENDTVIDENTSIGENVHLSGCKISNSIIEDFIILRKDGTPTYQLSAVADDHKMNITHVIRGDDHKINTFKQI